MNEKSREPWRTKIRELAYVLMQSKLSMGMNISHAL